MSEYGKFFYGFIGVMVVGFLIVYFSRETEQDKVGYALLTTGNMLNTYARDACGKAGEEKAGTRLYNPSDSQSDGNSYVHLTWKYTHNGEHTLTCRYEKDKGITEMTLDGAPISEVSVDLGSGGSSGSAGGGAAKRDAGH
ncbi:MAG TPA: hypothetical protein VNL74_08320 [Methylococcus sp.]|nr:hypothetical protein [Methylococcus sp.]